MSVTRYRLAPWDKYRADALPDDEGAWVRHADHEAEFGQWAATVDRVTQERDDEHLARVKAEARVRELEATLISAVGNVIEAIRELAPKNPAVAALCDAYAEDLAAVSAEKEEGRE